MKSIFGRIVSAIERTLCATCYYARFCGLHHSVVPKRMQEKISKSAKKREYLALQVLGEQLIGLPEAKLRDMHLDDALLDAILQAATIKSHSALRRQRQLIGKLMKRIDPDPVRAALESLTRDSRKSKMNFKQAEEWRDMIVANGHSSLKTFFALIGRENEELASLVNDLGRARTEHNRRTVRRNIYRQVHVELNTKD